MYRITRKITHPLGWISEPTFSKNRGVAHNNQNGGFGNISLGTGIGTLPVVEKIGFEIRPRVCVCVILRDTGKRCLLLAVLYLFNIVVTARHHSVAMSRARRKARAQSVSHLPSTIIPDDTTQKKEQAGKKEKIRQTSAGILVVDGMIGDRGLTR